MNFTVGERVELQVDEESDTWHYGTILYKDIDGSYIVHDEIDDVEYHKSEDQIRKYAVDI